MTAEARQRAARVAAKAELVSITLVDLTARLDEGLSASDAPVLSALEAQAGNVRDGVSLRYRADYTIALKHDEQQVARITCSFVVQYQVPEDFEAEESEYEAYGLTTVMFALHPFVRELVHATTSRLSLPPVTLDVLRLPMVLPSMDRSELPKKPSSPKAAAAPVATPDS
jgi:hypothetical protein